LGSVGDLIWACPIFDVAFGTLTTTLHCIM
jgi:hypothetical protein